MIKQKKRFIAGAVCPECGEMDSIRVFQENGWEYQECIRCEYKDQLNLDGTDAITELETRVNQELQSEQEAGIQPLLFVANPGSRRKDH